MYPNFVLVYQYDAGSGGALQSVYAINGVQYSQTTFGDNTASSLMTKLRKFFGGQHMVRNIGLVAGGGVLLLLLIWLGCCCWCCRRRGRSSSKDRQSLDLFVGATPFRPPPVYSSRPSPPPAEKPLLQSAAPLSTSPTKHPLLVTRPTPSHSPERRNRIGLDEPTIPNIDRPAAPLYEPTTARTDLRMNQASPYTMSTQAIAAKSMTQLRDLPARNDNYGQQQQRRPMTAGNPRLPRQPMGGRVDPFGDDTFGARSRPGPQQPQTFRPYPAGDRQPPPRYGGDNGRSRGPRPMPQGGQPHYGQPPPPRNPQYHGAHNPQYDPY